MSNSKEHQVVGYLSANTVRRLLSSRISVSKRTSNLATGCTFLPTRVLRTFKGTSTLYLKANHNRRFRVLVLLVKEMKNNKGLVRGVRIANLGVDMYQIRNHVRPRISTAILHKRITLMVIIAGSLHTLSVLPKGRLVNAITGQLLTVHFEVLVRYFQG